MLSTHNIFGSRPPTSRKRESLCSRITLVVDTALLSSAYSFSTPPCRVRRPTLGPDVTVCCTTYSKRACLVWDKRKGSQWLPGCQSQGRCSRGESAGPPEIGAQPEGPAPGRRPWDSGGSFPRGETTTAQCTGQYRLEPVPGRKPGIVRALYCLACLFVLNRSTPLITYFGAGGRCWWPGCLFPTPLPPFPP